MSRAYKFDKTFFDLIDTPIKAYFLGLILTDATIRHSCWDCRLRLNINDKEILERFKYEIQSEAPLKYEKGNPLKSRGDVVGLGLGSKDFILNLTKYNLGPRKSFSTTFPGEDLLPKHLQSSFVRGVFDGDGTLEKHKGQMYFYTSSETFASDLKSVLARNQILNCHIYENNRRGGRVMFYVRINSSGYYEEGSRYNQLNKKRINCLNTLKVYRYLYSDQTDCYLTRKKVKFEKLLLDKNGHYFSNLTELMTKPVSDLL